MKKVVVIFLISCCLLLTGCSVKKVDELTDAEKFAQEFNIDDKNNFVYTNIDEILDILNNETAIILFADSDDERSLKATNIIYEQSKECSVEKIYYFNPEISEKKQTKKYQKLSEEIENMIDDDDFTVPSLFAVKDGKVVNYCNNFSSEEELSEEYLTKKKLKQIKEDYSKVLTYQENE